MRMVSTVDTGAMRLWNLTYNDPKRWAEVHAISGQPLGFWASLKAGGTGSPRAELIGGSGQLPELLGVESARTVCNFERTALGAILYFRSRLEVYGAPFRRGEISGITRLPEGADERINIWCGWTDSEGKAHSGSIELQCSKAHAERMEAWIRLWLVK